MLRNHVIAMYKMLDMVEYYGQIQFLATPYLSHMVFLTVKQDIA